MTAAPPSAVATMAPALPPGPRSSPLAQLASWILRPFPFMEACAARYGDAFTVRFAGFGPLVFFSRPDDLRAIFTGDPDALHSGEANSLLRGVLGESSVLTLDGAEHLRQRRLLLPPFQGERMHAYAAAMRAATRAAIARFPRGRAFALQPHMQRITLDVILETVFGLRDARAAKGRLAAALEGLTRTIGSPYLLLLPPTAALFGARTYGRISRWITREVDAALAAEIRERRDAQARGEPARDDILSLLLRARHEDGAPMTDAELRDELVTLLLAGHETTATALAWTFSLVLAHPEARAKIEAEIRAAGESAGDRELPYLDAAIKESLRVRPIIPIVVRMTKRPVAVNGRVIPAGVKAAPCVYLAHRRPELYPEPDAFRPERFLGKKPDPYEWLPFGGGIRRCIGLSFALLEMRVVLATVLGEARLAPASAKPPAVRRRGLALAPADGCAVVFDGPLKGAGAPSST